MFAIQRDNVITLKVGPGETRATHRIAAPAQLRQLLRSLIETAPSR